MNMLSNEIINSLRCPLGAASLEQTDDFLVCTLCSVKFPIKDGIPVLLIDEAVLPMGIKDINELKCLPAAGLPGSRQAGKSNN